MLEKPAATSLPIHDLIARRWSPRAFAERPVAAEQLLRLLEAARWAPSCYNEQPWGFLVATRDDPVEHGRLLACLLEANRVWARSAPLLMISVARLRFARNDRPNRHAFHDVGLAVENLVLQATADGLVVHQMAGFDLERARTTYAIPEGFEPVTAIAVGYQAELDALPAELREREREPRTRKPLSQLAFCGGWGKPAPYAAD